MGKMRGCPGIDEKMRRCGNPTNIVVIPTVIDYR